MALISVEGLGGPLGGVPVIVGNALGQTQSVSQQEIATELTSRGYRIQSTVPLSPSISPPISPITTPAMTRPQAITKAVDMALRIYGLATRCTRLGGCALSATVWRSVMSRASILATSYLNAAALQTRTPSISPATSPTYLRLRGAVSPRVSGIARNLYGFGQDAYTFPVITQPPTVTPVQPTPPDMTTWDWVAIISQAASGVANTLQAYANARAQRERAGQTATLTADQIKQMVNQALLQDPNLNRAALMAAAAGAGGDKEPTGTPGWLIPAVVGIGVVVVMGGMGRGRR